MTMGDGVVTREHCEMARIVVAGYGLQRQLADSIGVSVARAICDAESRGAARTPPAELTAQFEGDWSDMAGAEVKTPLAPTAELTAEVERLRAELADLQANPMWARVNDLATRVLAAREAPPVDEVAGLRKDIDTLRSAVVWWAGDNQEEAKTCAEGRSLDRIEAYLRSK